MTNHRINIIDTNICTLLATWAGLMLRLGSR